MYKYTTTLHYALWNIMQNWNQPFPGRYLPYSKLNQNLMTNVKQCLTLKNRCRLIKVEDYSSNEGIIISSHTHTATLAR